MKNLFEIIPIEEFYDKLIIEYISDLTMTQSEALTRLAVKFNSAYEIKRFLVYLRLEIGVNGTDKTGNMKSLFCGLCEKIGLKIK